MVAALSWAARLKNGLARTREVLNTPVSELFVRRRVDESLFEDLETALLQADCGVPATQWLLTALRDKARREHIEDGETLKRALKDSLTELLAPLEKKLEVGKAKPEITSVREGDTVGAHVLLLDGPDDTMMLVHDAKSRVRELTVDQVKTKQDRGEKFHLIDVREESEWAKDHVAGAEYLGRGILERDAEKRFPDTSTEIVLYCGGGFRSALAADNLQKMGYTNVFSMDGGIRDWRNKGYPLTSK